MGVNQLIPMRFLIMMAHIVLLILLLWNRVSNLTLTFTSVHAYCSQ
jgi:hypothetical protein